MIAQEPPQNDLQDPSDPGPGFRKASSSSRCSRRRQQAGNKSKDARLLTRHNAKLARDVKWTSSYGTQSHAARNRKNVNNKSRLRELALLLSARSPESNRQTRSFSYTPKMARSAKSPYAWLWHSATRGRQQEKYSQVSRGCQSQPSAA